MRMHWNMEMVMTAIAFAFISAVLAVLADTRFGERVWRFGHWMTHMNSLPDNAEVGFIVGHEGLEARCTQAFWISAFQTFVAYWFLHESILACLLILIVGVPSAALGIVATPLIVKLFRQKGAFFKRVQATADKASETVEKVRSGEISLAPDLTTAKDVVKAAVAVAAAKVVDVAGAAKDSVMEHLPEFGKKDEIVHPVVEVVPVVPQVSAEEKQKLELDEAQAAIDRFTGKRKESE